MTLFEELKPFMDAQVDNGLGDSITYKINATPEGALAVTAFLSDIADDGGGFGMDAGVQPMVHRWQLKIAKAAIPERPSLKHIVIAAKLDGQYRPAANNLIDGGAYWIVDLQKAPA